jgi:DNA polymerase elongation subunit (family B)
MEMDLYSIAIFGNNLETVLMVDPEHRDKARAYQSFRNEQELLLAFFRIVREHDPDAFIGWNLIGFDLQWLSRKCKAIERLNAVTGCKNHHELFLRGSGNTRLSVL